MWRLCRSSLLAVLLVAAAPAVAQAADAWTSGAALNYVAVEGEANDLTVSLAAGTYTLTDIGAPLTAGANCTQVTPSQVTCPSAGITSLVLDARDGGDTVLVGSGTANAAITGGAGDDTLTGGDGVDTLNGGTDADRLTWGGASVSSKYADEGAPRARSSWTGAGAISTSAVTRPVPSLIAGDRVLHDSFGMGTVVEVHGQGDKAQAHVDFGSGGVKRLLLRFAPLEKV